LPNFLIYGSRNYFYAQIFHNLSRYIRNGDLANVRKMGEQTGEENGQLFIALNEYGRAALHIAVLLEDHAIVQYLANLIGPTGLRRGDNVRNKNRYFRSNPYISLL